MSILTDAEKLVNGERQSSYGDPILCAERTIKIFNAMTGLNLETKHAPMFNIAQKWAREMEKYKRDNPLDSCGYHDIYSRIMESK